MKNLLLLILIPVSLIGQDFDKDVECFRGANIKFGALYSDFINTNESIHDEVENIILEEIIKVSHKMIIHSRYMNNVMVGVGLFISDTEKYKMYLETVIELIDYILGELGIEKSNIIAVLTQSKNQLIVVTGNDLNKELTGVINRLKNIKYKLNNIFN